MGTTPALLNTETALAACRGDPVLAYTLIEQYRAHLPAEQAELVKALAATPPDWEAVRKQVHRLQSGSAYLGIERIESAARTLEMALLAHPPTALLMGAWQALERAFDEFLAVPGEDWERRLGVVNRPTGGAVP